MSNEYLGLEDMGKDTVSCANCSEDLFVIWKVDPNATDLMFAKAVCPFCGGYSKKIKINRNDRLGIPDSNKISHVDFGDFNGNTQILLPSIEKKHLDVAADKDLYTPENEETKSIKEDEYEDDSCEEDL